MSIQRRRLQAEGKLRHAIHQELGAFVQWVDRNNIIREDEVDPRKPDLKLRAVVGAMRKVNSTQKIADLRKAKKLSAAYKSPIRSLDVDAALDELGTWGTIEQPLNISIELRAALILFLNGGIRRKRSRKQKVDQKKRKPTCKGIDAEWAGKRN